jgi:hypothetical protein
MRYQLTQTGMSIGQWFLPVGTIIDDTAQDDFSKLVRERGLSPPLNAMPLDLATWKEMQRLYPEHVHRILTPAGLPR